MTFTGPNRTRRELAEELRLSQSWIYTAIKTGRFPDPSVPRKRDGLYLLDEVEAYLRAGRPDKAKWNKEHWGKA